MAIQNYGNGHPMAKGKKQIVNLIPEGESRDSHTYSYTAYKTASMISEQRKQMILTLMIYLN